MDLNQVIRPIKKWWWLIAVSTFLAAIVGYYFSETQEVYYQADATLIAGRTVLDPNPTSEDLYLGQQLALVYTAIAHQTPIIDSTREALELDVLPEYEIRALPNSQFIEIRVTDIDPDRAVAVTNELAAQLIAQSPGQAEDENEDRRPFILEQLDYLEGKIEETQSELAAEQVALAELTSARDIDQAQQKLLAIQEKLSTLQSTYASLIASSQSAGSNILTIIEPASNANPVGIEGNLMVAIAGLLGLLISISAAYFLDFVDPTIKSAQQVGEVLGLPILGSIPHVSIGGFSEGNPLETLNHPESPAGEAIHKLRTSLENLWLDKTPASLLVVGFIPGAGSTTLAISLASSFSLTERIILLADFNLRAPAIHKILELKNEEGLSAAIDNEIEVSLQLQQLDNPKIKVLPSGIEAANPAALFSSLKIRNAINQIELKADLSILDGPPFQYSEANLVASRVDSALLVLEFGTVNIEEAAQVLELLRSSSTEILGVVINKPKKVGLFSNSDFRVPEFPWLKRTAD